MSKQIQVYVLIALICAAFFTLQSFFIMWAWNFLAPLFHGPQIDFGHACAISLLVSAIGALFGKKS